MWQKLFFIKKVKQPPPINTIDSKKERRKQYIKLMKKNKWTRAELAKHLGVSRAWVTKVLNND